VTSEEEPRERRARIWPGDLVRWVTEAVVQLGTPPDVADDVSAVLVAADRRGIASHGTARLPQYVSLVRRGILDPAAQPTLERSLGAIALFDAHNGWGHHAGRVANDWAVATAIDLGCAIAVVRGSNHFGIAGWYAMRAAENGLVGIALSNSSPLVAPTRAREALIGTNPIAIAAPAGGFGTVVLDMATSTVSRGRIEVAQRRGEALHPSWALDEAGYPALSAEAALGGALLPLGGHEETGGYKGYGLALVVDILTGVLAGAAYGPNIVPLFSTEHGTSDLGHTFIVIDPEALDGRKAFGQRLAAYAHQLITAPVAPDAPDRVLIPGEPEASLERRSDEQGIEMDDTHAADLARLATELGVEPPRLS
jgi:LDH2 family malate/lactate/ureidoglycolate dehydrogenase